VSEPVVCTDHVSAGGVKLRYRWDGPAGAPVVLLSNSLGTSAAMWDPQVAALSPYCRLLRYEHRGHGGAPAPGGSWTVDDLAGDALGLLDALGLETVAVAGLSLGGMVAMSLAARHPARVTRLALLCTAPFLPPPSSWQERAQAVRADGLAPLIPTQLGRWFTPGFADRHPDVASLVAAMFAVADAGAYAACCEAIGAMDQRGDLASVAAPTLVIAGAADPVTPPATALSLAEAIPGAALAVVPGAAHLATLEQPQRVGSLLVDHLVGSPARRGDAVRRRVLGDEHVDRSRQPAGPFSASFADFITRYAWGEVWSRPLLDLRTRSCITLAALAALGREQELALHLAGARRNGLSDEEIAEVLLHVAVYAGVPAANSALALARRVLGDGG
jgi:3-oxoadipate enol-lactonase/4-carboxymuconolactone decarboxylase